MREIVPGLVVAVVLVATAPVAADTRSVETHRQLPASPARVIAAFLDDEALAGWWEVTRSHAAAEPGASWAVAWDGWGEGRTNHAWAGVLEEVAPDRILVGHLVMIEPELPLLAPMELEVRAVPAEGGSEVFVSHRGYGYGEHWETIYPKVVRGWEHALDQLEAWLSGSY